MKNPPTSGIISTFEPPDLVIARYVGRVDGPHVRAAVKETRPFIAQCSYFFVLFDITRLESATADARRASAENEQGVKLRGMAIVGASFHFRVLGALVARAVGIVQRHFDNPLRFFDTEEEARAWFDERRREIQAKATEPGQDR